jgi:pimeloyl-ACP methyl ester carboxylesterase
VRAVIDEFGLAPVLLLGESLGGGVGILLDQLRTGVVNRYLLCEAVAFETPRFPPDMENPMATAARKRRRVWSSRDEMVASYGSRPPLDVLAPEALAAYVQWGTVDRDDGNVELACDPDIEATIFEGSASVRGARLAWDHLLALTAPATVLAGTASNLPTDWFDGQAARCQGEHIAVAGSHFFLQEDTDRAVALVTKHLIERGTP